MIELNKCIRVILFLVVPLLHSNAYGQYEDIRFERISVNEGLVQSAIHDIIRDKYGYVWFGTRGGLSRFDGYEFVNYLRVADDTTSLSHSSSWSLMNAQDGNLWVGTANGLNLFDRTSEMFFRYEDPRLQGKGILQIIQWSTDTLLLGTQKGLYLFDQNSGKYSTISMFQRFEDLSINHIDLKNGQLYLGTNKGVFEIDGEKVNHLDFGLIIGMYRDTNERLWISSRDGLFLSQSGLENYEVISDRFTGDVFGRITSDGRGNILVARGYVDIYSMEGELKHSYQYSPELDYSLSDNSSISIYLDSDGILWVGTNGYGINKFDPKFPSIDYLHQSPNSRLSLSSDYVTSIYTADDRNIFIGTAGGLDMYDAKRNRVTVIHPRPVDYVYGNQRNLWVGTNDTLLHYTLEPLQLKSKFPIKNMSRVKSIYQDNNGIVWVASQLGLIRFDPLKRTSQIFLQLDEEIVRPTRDWITAIHPTDSSLLVGTVVGLYELRDGGAEAVKLGEGTPFAALKDTYVKSFTQDRQGNLWIGSWGDGVFKYDGTEVHQNLPTDGLPDDVIYGVLEDKDGYLWMSSNKGLSRYNPSTDQYFNIDVSYGLQSNEFNTTAFFGSENNKMYFGGIQGMNFFNPAGFRENTLPPETHITAIQVNNTKTSGIELGMSKSVMDIDTLVLSYKENMLGFDFKGANFTVPSLNQYAYYMDNLEDDWNYVGSRRYANYSSIPPGEYTFKVKSSNNDGYWDDSPKQLFIIIKPPFWNTWWFRGVSILLFGISVYAFIKSRNRYLEVQRTNLTKKVNEQTKEITETLEELRKTQSKLIETEKTSALSQVMLNLLHELNSPLGSAKSSIEEIEIDHSIELVELPLIIAELGEDQYNNFIQFIEEWVNHQNGYTPEEERNLAKYLKSDLEKEGVDDRQVFDILCAVGCYEVNEKLMKILSLPNHLKVLELAERIILKYQNLYNVDKAIQRSITILDSLRIYTDLNASKIKDFSLVESIEKALKMREHAFKRGVVVNKHYYQDVKLNGSRDQLTQLWLQLISNANQAMKFNGTLDITVCKIQNGKVHINFTDSGTGISEEIREKIFQPFYTSKPLGEGRGLGLDIAKKVVERHGGNISFQSKPGDTQFIVELPVN